MIVSREELEILKRLEREGFQIIPPSVKHDYTLRHCPGKNWKVSQWSFKRKRFYQSRAKFAFCKIHNQWAWAE